MAINVKDIVFRAKMPEIPSTANVVHVAAPDLKERTNGISRIAGRLGLGRLREIETEASRVWAGSNGEVEYFPASGAVWSRNLSISEKHKNELRDWPDVRDAKDESGQSVVTLGRESAKSAAAFARGVAEEAGFDLSHVASERIDVVQVSQLSEKGKILSRGAGEASWVISYAVDDVAVLGAGAKTVVDIDPAKKGSFELVGAFHVWRRPLDRQKVEIGGPEGALAAGLLQDPDLNLAAKKGGRITVEELKFGLMALPAPAKQEHLFPVLMVAGRVDWPEGKLNGELGHYRFGRYCHAATPKAYAAAGIYADYLARPN